MGGHCTSPSACFRLAVRQRDFFKFTQYYVMKEHLHQACKGHSVDRPNSCPMQNGCRSQSRMENYSDSEIRCFQNLIHLFLRTPKLKCKRAWRSSLGRYQFTLSSCVVHDLLEDDLNCGCVVSLTTFR